MTKLMIEFNSSVRTLDDQTLFATWVTWRISDCSEPLRPINSGLEGGKDLRDDGTLADGRLLANLPWHSAALLPRHCLTTLAWYSLTRLTWDNLALFVRDCLAPLFLEHSGTFELGRLRSLLLTLMARLGTSTHLVWHFSFAPHCTVSCLHTCLGTLWHSCLGTCSGTCLDTW